MFKIKVICPGKIKEPWLQEALNDYEKRLQNRLSLQWVLAKSDSHLEELCLKEDFYICLDIQGTSYTSHEFSQKILQFLETRGSRLCFVIGGALGLGPSLLKKANAILSLSSLTFTHQMIRLILLEQLYRALEINRGSPYHK